MNIIIINKKKLKNIITFALLCSFSFIILNYSLIKETSDKNNTYLFNKSSIDAFLVTSICNEGYKHVEIFNINMGSVIKKVPLSETIKSETIKYLNQITGVYVKVKAFPDRGYIIKIPLEPAVKIQNAWLDDLVDEVFIIFPEQEMNPYLLILNNKNMPFFYTFEGNTEILFKQLDFYIE